MTWVDGILAYSWAFYPGLIFVLAGLIAYAMWRGHAMSGKPAIAASITLAAAVMSRLILSSGTGQATSLVGFSLLNLVGYFAFGRVIERGGDTNDVGRTSMKTLWRDAALLAAGTASLALLIAAVSGTEIRPFSLVSVGIVGASIRLIAFAFQTVWARHSPMNAPTLLGLTMITASWLLVQLAPLAAGPNTLLAARTLDVLTALVTFGGILSAQAHSGRQYQAQATRYKEDAETAQAKLDKLSKIATDIYEDSSDVIRKQKEQTLHFMKKVENLERILQIGVSIQRRHRLEDVLQMVAELVRDHLGFKTVVLRLLNGTAQSFETYASVGVSDAEREEVANYRIPMSEYKKLIEPRNRISKSYLVRRSRAEQGPGEGGVVADGSWDDVGKLVVPLTEESNETVGYLSVENATDPSLSVGDVIESLEVVGALSTIAIRNARILEELRDKNEKLKDYTEKMASLNKLKSDFVATVSHEFRTPLTSIKAYSETLLGNADYVDRELLKQFLVVIDEESTRLMTTIEDILDFSQMESGAMKFERRECNVLELVNDAGVELKRHFEARGITFDRDVPDGPVYAWAEEDLIRQLIVNLLHNAAKFTRVGGNARIRVVDDVVAVRIIVEDEGSGVPDSELGKIFEQFHQVDSSMTREHAGSGLGLAICKNIVDWHDGRIWAENVPGSGARFVAVIPKKQVVVKCHAPEVCGSIRKFEIERFLELLVETVAELAHARRVSVMTFDARGETLNIGGAIGLDEAVVDKARIKVGEGIAGRVAQEGKSWLVTDIETDRRILRANNAIQYESKSFMSVPMRFEDETVGVINVASPAHADVFTEADCALIEQLARRLAIALVKLRSYAYASVNYEQAREALRSILDSQRFIDRHEDGNLTSIVSGVGRKLGLNEDEVARLRYIMSVYDLGLSKIGYHIVKKPGDLSPREREEMRKHVQIGADMLEVVETSPDIRDIILHHHENYDGSGYPNGLQGSAIPVEARIIRVADSLRALISKRPYQRQYSIDEAKEVVKHRAGSYFDPDVVVSFVEALDEHAAGGSDGVTEAEETLSS